MWWRTMAIGAVLAAIAAACSTDAPLSDWDYVGVVDSIEFDQAPPTNPTNLYSGGPESALLVSTMTITFTDGISLDIADGTPGGNWCRDLAGGRAQGRECVVAASLTDGGDVEWFELLSPTPGGIPGVDRTRRTFLIRELSETDGRTIVARGLRFAIAADVEVVCGGNPSLEEAVADFDVFAELEIPSLEVVAVRCEAAEI